MKLTRGLGAGSTRVLPWCEMLEATDEPHVDIATGAGAGTGERDMRERVVADLRAIYLFST